MTKQERTKMLIEINRLRESLENWLETPMLECVREIGAKAIKRQISELSRPLRQYDYNCLGNTNCG